MADNHDAIMEHLIDIKKDVATIIAKHESTHAIVEKLEKKVGKQNGRVNKLEIWRSYIIGGWAVIGIIAGIVWKLWK